MLQCGPIDHEDSFFDLGGDSLLAVSLLAEIKSATGQDLPLTAIYDAASVRALAELLEAGEARPSDPVVPFQPGALMPAFFMVHGIFGNVAELKELSRHMPTPQAIFGLQPRGLDGREPPHDRVDAMADHYLLAIKRVQARGPYVLLGYSFGGLVALEMAVRLRARGEQVGFLGLIDSYPNPQYWPWLSRIGVLARRSRQGFRLMAGMGLKQAWAAAWKRVADRSGGLREAASAEYVGDVALPPSLRRVREAGYKALINHVPPRYDGPVAFFRAGTSHQFPADPVRAWQPFLTNLSVNTLSGDHYSMVGAHGDRLGRALCATIAAALKSPRAEPLTKQHA